MFAKYTGKPLLMNIKKEDIFCNHELDIFHCRSTTCQQAYPFTIETMPVQKDIVKGQTTEIRCTLKREGNFADTRCTTLLLLR